MEEMIIQLFERMDKVGEFTLETVLEIYPLAMKEIMFRGVMQLVVGIVILISITIFYIKTYKVEKELKKDKDNLSSEEYIKLKNKLELLVGGGIAVFVFAIPIVLPLIYFGLNNLYARHWKTIEIILENIK